ncbi:succinate dehydrogenase subunit D [Tistlia consotensis]|uniref:Succinate dehydrogenase hydrophobic membrane anchor subunit n=1 Tax=Tistlia consotensis USBA 355 TaxID=560819 RepID=A0A1Y6CL82_9PROT|nr:succinate dehydrogenase, hydrophobic membrane anchor protein [Tistlia consotensis]SMF74970.1 succinate dehydrogenase subunit D [Tistlia consotensis USBA 355]SNS11592.1 succinate dehydrogenase subunit D [Tistlia consotensis]
MSLRSPLARVRHLGSAHDGTAHWWAQRLTALALVPLVLWFVISVISLIGSDYESFVDWAGSPVSGALLVLLIGATFWHAALGLQVVIEDYVHREGCKLASVLLVKGACLLLGAIAALSVLSLMV